MVFGVPGGKHCLQRPAIAADAIAMAQDMVWLEFPVCRSVKHIGLAKVQLTRSPMPTFRQDRCAGNPRELTRQRRMIDMRMRDHDMGYVASINAIE